MVSGRNVAAQPVRQAHVVGKEGGSPVDVAQGQPLLHRAQKIHRLLCQHVTIKLVVQPRRAHMQLAG